MRVVIVKRVSGFDAPTGQERNNNNNNNNNNKQIILSINLRFEQQATNFLYLPKVGSYMK